MVFGEPSFVSGFLCIFAWFLQSPVSFRAGLQSESNQALRVARENLVSCFVIYCLFVFSD